jgi:uncharacterized surface protein with fasciclin (FAS1) repeats
MNKNMIIGVAAVAIILGIGALAINQPKQQEAGENIQKEQRKEHSMNEKTQTNTIVDIAVNTGNFKTLVAAVQAAGLVETLQGEGPFTVFAPTDDAFAKIDKTTLESILADKEKLTKILTYHVALGKMMAEDIAKISTVTTVQGGNLTIDTTNGVKINNATVTATDIEASNGVIHVIDTVLLPQF